MQLPRGVGAGPSGERYEHIKAISKTAAGMDALLELGMQLVRGCWDPRMKDGRLAALNKTDGGIRPVLSGEALRRAVGNWHGCGASMCATAAARVAA